MAIKHIPQIDGGVRLVLDDGATTVVQYDADGARTVIRGTPVGLAVIGAYVGYLRDGYSRGQALALAVDGCDGEEGE